MAHDTEEPELDEDGLIIQRYDSVVLVVVPPAGYGDQILRYARSSLYNVHVGTRSVSSVADDLIKGRLQDEFMVDGSLAEADMADYAGIVIAGSEGESPFAHDEKVLQLVREAHADGKLIATWGNALAVLAAAGVVKGRKVTGDPASEELVRRAGGKFTGREIEVAKHIVTARDEGAGMRFGQSLAEIVRI
jgi:putative intracellular protease/amidase